MWCHVPLNFVLPKEKGLENSKTTRQLGHTQNEGGGSDVVTVEDETLDDWGATVYLGPSG